MDPRYQSETAGEQPFAGESEGAGEFWRRRRRRRMRFGMRPRFFRRRRRRIFSNPNFGGGGFGGGFDSPEPEPPDSDDDAGESEFRGRVGPGRFVPRAAFRSAAYRRPLVRRFGLGVRPRVAFRSGIRPRIVGGRYSYRPGVWRGRYPFRSGVWAGRYRPGFRPGWGGRYPYRGGVVPSAWRGGYRYPLGYRYGLWRGRYPYRPGVPYPFWPGLLTAPPPYPIAPPVEAPPPESGAPLAPPPPVVAAPPPTAVFDPSLLPPAAPPDTPAEPPPAPSADDNADAAPGGDAPAPPDADGEPPADAPASEFYFEYGGSPFTPTPVENPGGGRIADRRVPNRSEVVQVRGVGRNLVPLHRLAAAALEALLAAARAEGLGEPLLRPVSGFRDPARQTQLWQQALRRYGSPQVARRWVAPPGHSAHQTGRAIDFHLGGHNSSERVAQLRTLPAYQWLVRNAARFGFYPYANEPWHWEYNPPANGRRH